MRKKENKYLPRKRNSSKNTIKRVVRRILFNNDVTYILNSFYTEILRYTPKPAKGKSIKRILKKHLL